MPAPDRRPRGARRDRFADEVADELRSQILSGKLALGERIDQDTIADAHAMSRLPVREALIALEQEGLVVNLPRRGSYVATIEPEDILDQYEVYGLVAGMAAERAAQRLSDDDIAGLRRAHEKFVKARVDAAQQRANEEFHRIVNRAGGTRLRSTLGLLARSLPSHHYSFDSAWSERAADHHAEVLAAIEARDPARARQAMVRHLVESGHEAVQSLRNGGFWGRAT